MKKILIPALIVLAVFILSFLYLIFSGSDTISGTEAFMIASTRWTYWLGIVVVSLAAAVTIFIASKNEVTGLAVNFIAFGIAAAFVLALLAPVANIKADPIGSGASTEQINNLKEKGDLK